MFSAIRSIVFTRSEDTPVKAYVSWPSDPVTDSLIRRALSCISTEITFMSKKNDEKHDSRLLQWCSYSEMDHELAHFQRQDILSSSYAFRNALVTKHHFLRAIQAYLVKNPQSILSKVFPRSYEIELSFVDELEEMWTDELCLLGQELDDGASWWILKSAASSPRTDIKIFKTKQDLEDILSSFEESATEEEDSEEFGTVSSQNQHFIVQRYMDDPLLLSQPRQESKFHMRAFCLASGSLQLYLYKQIVVFFASAPFENLDTEENAFDRDIAPHITNPPRNPIDGNDVYLLQELEGAQILSEDQKTFEKSDIDSIFAQIQETLAEVFKAAQSNPLMFQARPNAFELYAVDFLVSHHNKTGITLIGIDAEPTFRFIGSRLDWVLDDMFAGIAKVAVQPFYSDKKESISSNWQVGTERHNYVKFLHES